MVKKIIIGVVILILAIIGYFVGKNIYYNKIYNYPKIVNKDMENYYKSNNTSDIDSIRDLLKLYEENEEITIDIKNKVFNNFNDWYEYVNKKYICTLESLNQCILYEKELDDLSSRLTKLRIAEIIDEDKEEVVAKEIDNKIEELNETINNPNANNGETYEEHRLAICNKVSDDNCVLERDGTSICTYVLGTIKEIVQCKKAISEEHNSK